MTALSVKQAADLMGQSARAIRKACREGRISARTIAARGGDQYQIELSALPPQAQHRYLAQHLKATHPPAGRREALQQLNLEEQAERKVARAAGITRKPRAVPPAPPTAEDSTRNQQAFDQLSSQGRSPRSPAPCARFASACGKRTLRRARGGARST